MVKQIITPLNKSVRQKHLSRLYFLSKGCKQVPPDEVGGKILWAHPDGYFLNAKGQKVKDNFCPAMKVSKPNMHAAYPIMRSFSKRLCHHIMALAFYGERKIFKDKNSKLYVGICHHLIPDKIDYRPANLLCWLTREEHSEADRRQRLIKKVVGIEGMREIGYTQLRFYQDPCETSAVDFEAWFNLFKEDQL